MIVFLHIPKTAGSTFNFILENSLGLSACHTNHTKQRVFAQADLDFARKLFPRLKGICGHNLIDPLQLSVPDAFYMTFVREPLARVISQYQDGVLLGGNRMSFEEALRTDETLENLQVKLMAGERNLDKAKHCLEKCSFVGLTEQFELSLKVLKQLSPYKLNLNYKRRRVAPANRIKAAIEADGKLLEQARERNQLDLELYAHATQEVFPRLCARAGVDPTDKPNSHDRYRTELHFRFLLFSAYNMLVYRQACKFFYRRRGRSSRSVRF